MIRGRLWLANQLLRDRIGHHYGYNLALADAAERAGMSPQLVVHRSFREAVPAGVGLHRVFRTDLRADPPAWAATNARLLRWLELWCDRRFAADLRRIPVRSGEDCVFAQMIAPRHFMRWLNWHQSRPEPPTLFLHLGYRPERFTAVGPRQTLKSLGPDRRSRILLVTDSEKLCKAFGEALEEDVHYLPHILSHHLPLNTRCASADAPLQVFVPGNARREKGFMETVQAARILAGTVHHRHFRFIIQSHSPDLACSSFLRGPDKAGGESIEWIDRPLADEEYLTRLGQADLVLLPYHLDCYAARTSGIFTEARVAGIPVMTTTGSWAGDRVAREGGGWLTPERDAQALVAALLSARQTHEPIKLEALALAGQARAEFHRDNFMTRLLALARGEVPS